MSKLLRSGFKTGLIFSVQRPDATRAKPNYDVDPEFSSLLKALAENGLKIFALKAAFIPEKGVYVWSKEPPPSF